MADLISINEHYAYLRLKVPRSLYDALLLRHDGAQPRALRELRYRWQETLSALDVAAPAGSSPSSTSTPEPLRQSPQ